jgi:dienelactone hydrolase
MEQPVLAVRIRRLAASLTLLLVTAVGSLTVASPALADEIGSAPTAATITGNGSFAVTSATISGQSGFGGGTVYYPTTAGTYPVVAVMPGFLELWSAIQWMGPRLASWGFVVVGINPNSVFDFPSARATQQLAALNWAVGSAPSAVKSRADGSRRGVAGYSMGGGGTVEALADDTSGLVKAGVAFAPWQTDTTWPSVTEPVFIVGGQNDTVAPPASHAIPIYNSLAGPKTYVELAGQDHDWPQSDNPTGSRALVSWFKRYLNGDTRFTPYTCGFSGSAISAFQSNAC